MRIRRNVVGIGVASVVAATLTLALAGCVQPSPPVIPTAVSSAKPVFASNAAALAAAKRAFTGYVAASDAIGNDGGKDPGRIAQWVTPARLKTETKVFDSFAKTGNRLTGNSLLSAFKLQQLNQSANGKVDLTAYVCDDVSGSRLLDSSGNDITPASRQDVIPFVVDLTNVSAGSKILLVEGSKPWSGTTFCL